MKITFTTDITEEPVTLEEVKKALRITGTGHDDDLETMISDARTYIEKALDMSVSEREIEVVSDIELEEWELPFGPVSDLEDEYAEDDYGNYVYTYTYTGGNEDCPADVKRLIIMLIKFWFDIDDLAVPLPGEIRRLIQANTRQPMAL